MRLLIVIGLLFCSISLAADQAARDFYQQQQSFYIEDILSEMQYLQPKVEDGTATEYELFKYHKLETRLKEVTDISTQDPLIGQ